LSPPNAKFADLETWNAASDNAKISDQRVAAIRVTSRVLDRCYRTVNRIRRWGGFELFVYSTNFLQIRFRESVFTTPSL